MVDAYGDRILDVTAAGAERWGAMTARQPLPVVDGLLAATALEHDLTFVTRNDRDVQATGGPVHNPFSG